MTTPTLVIGVPSLDMVHAKFVLSLTQLMANIAAGGTPFSMVWKLNQATGRARNSILHAALESGAEHIMLLDSDMTFAPDTYARLAARIADRHDVRFVSAPYWTRNEPWTPAFQMKIGSGYQHRPLASFPDGPSAGLKRVDIGGVAVSLMTRALAIDLYNACPPSKGGVFGRDPDDGVSFSLSMADLGEPIYVDATMSVGHCGIVEVDEAMGAALRAERERRTR
jgi:hypothetical protein